MDRIIRMIMNLLLRRAINTGINKGVKAMRGSGTTAPRASLPDQKRPNDTEEAQRKADKQAVREARRARRAARQAKSED